MNHASTMDPRLIWQNQDREHPVMSLQEIQSKAAAVHARVRRNLILAVVIGFLLLMLCTITIITVPMTPVRPIAGAMIVVVVGITATAFNRLRLSKELSRQAGLHACLTFYRNELLAQYRAVYLRWRLLVPLVVFVWLSWMAVDENYRHLVMRVFLPAVLVVFLFVRRREVRRLRQELAALNEFEEENLNGVEGT